MPKHHAETNAPPECPREPMGLDPSVLSKRVPRPYAWCAKDIEFDPWCDPYNPKTILPRDIYKAASMIGQKIQTTPLVKSKCCVELGLEVFYKLECFNQSHSYLERGAHYALQMLKDDQMRDGIFSASMGNWGVALALKARYFKVPLTVVLPETTPAGVLDRIRRLGATAVPYGRTLAEAKTQAFILRNEKGCGTYLNGYDHPHVIAASGIIGLEILKQLPQTDAILIPVGGGGLIAGIAALIKQHKPKVLIYGIEPNKCCSFFKAMENEQPYRTECGFSIAGSLAVPTVGYNAYHTAVSLIDKMVLTEDDWIAQAILHLAEEEKMVVDGTGAISLSTILHKPNVLPELQGKTVVCILTSSNIDNWTFALAIDRAQAVDGRKIYLTVKLGAEDMKTRLKIFNVIANLGVNIVSMETEEMTFIETDVHHIHLNLVCETRDLPHACSLKRVLTRVFPDICEFLEMPFSPIPICMCTPKPAI